MINVGRHARAARSRQASSALVARGSFTGNSLNRDRNKQAAEVLASSVGDSLEARPHFSLFPPRLIDDNSLSP